MARNSRKDPVNCSEVSSEFIQWAESITGLLTHIKTEYGSIAELVEHPQWDETRNAYVLSLLTGLKRDISKITAEFKGHVNGAKKSMDDATHDGLMKWRAAHPKAKRWNVYDVADWLIKHEGFGLEKRLVRREIAKLLAHAQNRKRIRNKRGKLVRVYHAAKLPVRNKKGEFYQKTFWAERLTMSADFAHKSMDGRLKQTEGMCRSMFIDAEDVNENNPNLKGNPIQLEFNFEYIKSQKKAQKVETIPVEGPMQMIVTTTAKGMSAAKKFAAKDL